MQAQSVTEIGSMRKAENVRATQGEGEWPSSAGRREGARGRRKRGVEGEREEGGEDDGAQKQAPADSSSSALCAADMTLSAGLC